MVSPAPSRMDAREIRTARAEDRREIAAARVRRGRDRPWRRRFRDLRRRLTGGLAARLAPPLIRLLARSWRVERIGGEETERLFRDGPVILVLWHGRMLPAAALHRDRRFAVLVSPSGDGAIAVGVLARLGLQAFRGSTSRGGARALRELASHLRAGSPVGLTPDGPRGPRHAFNTGAAWLARETGAPIVSVAVACDRAWRQRSWDRFTIPRPRARVELRYGTPVRIGHEVDDDGLEAVSAQLRDRLIADEIAAFSHLDVPDDHPASIAPNDPG